MSFGLMRVEDDGLVTDEKGLPLPKGEAVRLAKLVLERYIDVTPERLLIIHNERLLAMGGSYEQFTTDDVERFR